MIRTEEIKRIHLVEFLTHHYGMKFSLRGQEYVSLSSFTSEREPSFHVRQVEGKWLFKDFSSGHGGSIIDFVLLKEGFSEVARALEHIQKVVGNSEIIQAVRPEEVSQKKSYDLNEIYQKIKTEDISLCKDYLLGRGLGEGVIEEVIREGLVLHNRHQGQSWCCFAVFDQRGNLCCLDNHKIEGEGKFVLGEKSIFTYDWKILPQAQAVFICEGIIDYLSMKTLLKKPMAGMALLGNRLSFDPELLQNTQEILSAMDSDEGGLEGLLEIQDRFSDKKITVFSLGDCKDPNEYLMATKEGKEESGLKPEDKLQLYKEFMVAENKTEVAQRWGINRSYMYEIIKECEENIMNGFSHRRPGRKPQGAPVTLEEAVEKIKALEEEREQAEIEKERYYARSEFMKLRLKWAQIEADELRGKRQEGRWGKKAGKKKEKEETVELYKSLGERLVHLGCSQIIKEANYSRSQFYAWLLGIDERKKRQKKTVSMEVAEKAVEVIGEYPHFSAPKGQGYMIYHRLGYIPQHTYKMLKDRVRRLIFQEVQTRALLPERGSYEHERPQGPGEIWAEDFTRLGVYGQTFYVGLLIDVASTYYLGTSARKEADNALVEVPVIKALEVNGNCGPKRFLLSDNGSQYVSDKHGRVLDKFSIVQKRIPSCTPEYNGSIECGVKEFKNVFYSVFAEKESKDADKGKTLLERVQQAVEDTAWKMNHEIPRPCLHGVTPFDVQRGLGEEKRQMNRQYVEQVQQKRQTKPWTKNTWDLVKDVLFKNGLTDLELITKFCFFLKRPLRKLPNLMPRGVG